MGRRIGYARVSTDDQDLAIQKTALDKDGCAIVFEEKRSGTKRSGREQLELALKVLMKGDTLAVTRLDRLGRSLRDLANITHEIETAGATNSTAWAENVRANFRSVESRASVVPNSIALMVPSDTRETIASSRRDQPSSPRAARTW